MKIVVCYPHVNAFMAACWRELISRGVDLFVIGFKPGSLKYPIAFDAMIMHGIPHRLLEDSEIANDWLVASAVVEQKPDMIMLSGWSSRCYRKLPADSRLSNVRFIMSMDNQRKYSLKQFAGKWLLRKYLNRMDFVFVPGERSWQLAKYFGVDESRIRRGCLGIDYNSFTSTFEKRRRIVDGWPRAFLFAGRYVNNKGIDCLLDAYKQYRESSVAPWPLRCAGMGPLLPAIESAAGVENLGFVQPAMMPDLYAGHAVLVLPSRFEAWGQVIVESCAAGLPVICSEACGSSVEMIRSYYNGLTVPTGDVDSLAASLKWTHDHADQLPLMGARSHEMAAAYSAAAWADRVQAMISCA